MEIPEIVVYSVVGLIIGYVARGVQSAITKSIHDKRRMKQLMAEKQRAINEGDFEARKLNPQMRPDKTP